MKSIAITQNDVSRFIEKPQLVEEDLPAKKGFLYSFFKKPIARPYYRLALGVILLNLLVLFNQIGPHSSLEAQQFFSFIEKMIFFNFALGIFVRQHWFVNFLFSIATSIPHSAPLSIRWAAAKVYHFGGLHIGAFASGTALMVINTGLLVTSSSIEAHPYLLPVLSLHCLILLGMIYVSLPKVRFPKHDLFERTVRFGSWASLLLFWTQMALATSYNQDGVGTFASDLLNNFYFFPLVYLTYCVVAPWLHLKKIDVDIETPSNHVAIADFNYGVTPFAGSSTELSTNPLLEWHSFANIPLPGREGFKLTISRAGDWTGELIDKKPKKLWVRAIPTAGVGNIEKCFKKVVWVATGSGIGPCLPHLLSQEVPAQLVWSTRTPEITYGQELVDQIRSVQPNAIIWDTVKQGKPDLVKLAYKAFKDSGAEAVICISNQKLTFLLNEELETRGIPCLGAIWDS